MLRAEKAEIVDGLRGIFSGAGVVVVTHYMGLYGGRAAAPCARGCATSGARFRVTKNRLAKLAIDGTAFASIGDLFTGPTAIAYSMDPVAAPKVVSAFAKKNDKLKIVGGALPGRCSTRTRSRRWPSCRRWTSCRAKLLSLINTPATRLVGGAAGARPVRWPACWRPSRARLSRLSTFAAGIARAA